MKEFSKSKDDPRCTYCGIKGYMFIGYRLMVVGKVTHLENGTELELWGDPQEEIEEAIWSADGDGIDNGVGNGIGILATEVGNARTGTRTGTHRTAIGRKAADTGLLMDGDQIGYRQCPVQFFS